MRQINRQLQRLDRAIAKATKPNPREELRRELEKLRDFPPDELARRYQDLLDSAAAMSGLSRYDGMSCEDLLREFRALLEQS